MKFRWLETPQEHAKSVAERWRAQYHKNEQWSNLYVNSGYKSSEAIYHRLVALGASPDPKDVAEIIGNDGWTSCGMCDGCGSYQSVVLIGEEPDYESSTVVFCDSCMRALIAFYHAGRPVE